MIDQSVGIVATCTAGVSPLSLGLLNRGRALCVGTPAGCRLVWSEHPLNPILSYMGISCQESTLINAHAGGGIRHAQVQRCYTLLGQAGRESAEVVWENSAELLLQNACWMPTRFPVSVCNHGQDSQEVFSSDVANRPSGRSCQGVALLTERSLKHLGPDTCQ